MSPRFRMTLSTSQLVERLGGYGQELASAGQLELANWLLFQAEGLDEEKADVREIRAACLLDMGRPDEAAAAVEAALAIAGPTARRLYLLGTAQLALGEIEAGLQIAQEASILAPHDPRMHVLRSRAELATGNLSAARTAADAALKADPNYAPCYVAVAQVARAEGRLGERVSDLTQAVALFPQSLQLRTLLGEALQADGRTREAQLCWADILSRDETNRQAAKVLAQSVGGWKRWRLASLIVVLLLPSVLYSAVITYLVAKGNALEDATFSGWLIAVGAYVAGKLFLKLLKERRWSAQLRPVVERALNVAQDADAQPLQVDVAAFAGMIALVTAPGVLLQDAEVGGSAATVFGLFYLGPIFLIALLRGLRSREQARADEFRMPFDASVCHCASLNFLSDEEAIAYVESHLAEPVGTLLPDVDVFRCGRTGRHWLLIWKAQAPDLEGVALPALFAVSGSPLEEQEERQSGMYL